FAGIDQIPAGCAFELTLDGRRRPWTYWSLAAIEPEPTTDVEAAFAELLEDAVRLRLRSDVPVGVCLSGGTLAQTGAALRRISLSPEAMWDSLGEVLRFQDEPIISGAPIAGFHLMKLAASNVVRVVLNGQGSEEVLAGYPTLRRTGSPAPLSP